MSPELRAALDELEAAWLRGCLYETDPDGTLAFRVVQAYRECDQQPSVTDKME